MRLFAKILRGMLLRVIYPLLMIAGSVGGREALQAWVIKWNNRLVRMERPKIQRLLLLLPHCIQIDKCDVRLTHNVYNCKRCGKCQMKDMIEIAEQNGQTLFMATGGTLARRIVKDARPEGIVAVACERDLSSGIADIYPIPVLGVTNIRPHGPCFNTQVDLELVKEAVAEICGN